ncbi:hypothetical protein JCM10213_008808 [Rhodosporidiobolus nylandii]
MIRTPPFLNLPSGSTLIEDVDEEIFLLYTRKQQLASLSAPSAAGSGHAGSGGLGSLADKEGVLRIELAISSPWAAQAGEEGKRAKGGRKKGKEKGKEKTVEVEVEVHQSLDLLRHRKGDTGSVLWRLSLHLATYLLRSHHFPHAAHPPLLPLLSTSRVLEVGSGTGFLGLALRSIFLSPIVESGGSEKASWTFTDQLENLPLVVRNLRGNGVDPSASGTMWDVAIEELDWVAESTAWEKAPGSLYSSPSSEAEPPDLILAADCIYNPSLSAPLARTILRHSGPKTVVLIASELRDEEPLEAFLRAWTEEGGERWRVARLGWGGEERVLAGELAGGGFVVWVGWQDEAREGE